MEDLRKINTELQGTIKNLSLKLEEEHHASDSTQREAKAQLQQLEVQIRPVSYTHLTLPTMAVV